MDLRRLVEQRGTSFFLFKAASHFFSAVFSQEFFFLKSRLFVGNGALGALFLSGSISDGCVAAVPHADGVAAHATPGSFGKAPVAVELRHTRGCHGGETFP